MTTYLPRRPNHGRHLRPSRGFSLIDLLCVTGIAAVLLGQSLPLLLQTQQRQSLMSAAAQLETDLQLARSQAQTLDRSVRLSLQHPEGGGACYALYTGPAEGCSCDADGQTQCVAGAQLLRAQGLPAAAGVQLASPDRTLTFDAGKGTVTPTATLVLSDRDGRAVHQIVNVLGRIRSCSPTALGGLPRCR